MNNCIVCNRIDTGWLEPRLCIDLCSHCVHSLAYRILERSDQVAEFAFWGSLVHTRRL